MGLLFISKEFKKLVQNINIQQKKLQQMDKIE